MIHATRLSQLMKLSWEIQRKKQHTRSRALQTAWAILLHEDIMVFHLVKKHSHDSYPNKVQAHTLTLFTQQ